MADYAGQYVPQGSAYGQGYHQSPSKPELPRSISTTNLETTRQCQDFVSKDLCSAVPSGGTYFFMDLPGYTFTVPYLTAYPPDFRQFVFDRIVDKTAKKALEDEKCLNWCQQATKLEPLHTKGDGNCLLHAASLGMWGFQDRANILRNAVSQAVQHATGNSNTLYPRWRHNKLLECRQQGFSLEPAQWQREWDTVVRQASCDPTATSTLYSLEEFHVFVLANVLRRPVIMYASQKMRSIHTGGTMQCINFHGVYLPLLWDPNSCKKDPLPLAYQNGHFSALVVIDFAQQYRDGKLVLPLVSCDGYHLPVRFMLQDENPQSLLNDYVSIIHIANPAYSHNHIPCASLCVNTKPAYYDRLVGAFIEVCHSAYLQQQQQQQQQQYPYRKEMSGSGANGYPAGKVMGDGMYAHTESTTGPIESSYSVVQKDQIWDPTYSQGTATVSEQSNKVKCINSCGMYGDPTTAGLCSKCYKKSLDAELQQGTTHVRQLRPSTSDSGFNSSTSLTASGSIKCPNCSRPGHPNFLGMCETCYNGSQVSNQRQAEQQPATQQEYRNQAFQPQQYEQPQHLVQPVYGNQQQPLYGNDSDIQPQYGNQGASRSEQATNPYESLDKYQKPTHSPHLQTPREDPPPLPLPRSTASSNERNKCRTPNCEFYGTAETRYYCSKCFERDMTSIFSEVDKPATAVPNHSYQPHPPQYHAQRVSTGASPMMQNISPQHAPAEKCSSCHEYFGAPEYGGLCHGCFKNKTKGDSNPTKCTICNNFFGSEEYGGLCNGCFLKKTENETTGTQHLPHAPPTCTAPDMNLPSAAFTFGDSPTPIHLPPKPEQSQQMLQPNYAGAPPAQYGQPQQYAHLQSHPVNTVVTQGPPPGNRPVPKPRNRTAMNTVKQQPVISTHTYTAPVAAETLSPAVAAMNISNEVCFICTGTNPDMTKSYSVCQMHAQLMTKQIPTASQGSVGGTPLQNSQVQQNPNTFNEFPNVQGGHIQTSSGYNATPPIPPRGQVGQYSQTPSVPGLNYATSAGNQQLLAPQYAPQTSQPPQSSQPHYSGSGYIGGANLPYNFQHPANSQFPTGTAAMKPKPQPPLNSQLTPYSVAGGANQPPYNSSQPGSKQYHVPGQHLQPALSHYSESTGYKQQNLSPATGGGAMLNDLNTNTSGTGISAQQEEMSTIGSGAHSRLHPGQGIVGGGGVIGGGSGGNPGIIQSGLPAGDNGASGVSGSAPKKKVLCRTAGCSFYGNKDLEGLCSNCYEEYYEVKPPEQKM